MKHQRLVVIALVLFFGVPFVAYTAASIAGWLTHDLPSVDASAITPKSAQTLVAEENGYSILNEAAAKLQYPNAGAGGTDPSLRLFIAGSGSTADGEKAQTLVDTNTEALDLFDKASAKQYQVMKFSDQSVSDLTATLTTNFLAIRQLAEVQAAHAIIEFTSGQADNGVNNALGIVRVGNAMEARTGPLIQYLVGQRIKTLGVNALGTMIDDPRMSAAMKHLTNVTLQGTLDSGVHVAKALKVEFTILHNGSSTNDARQAFAGMTFGPIIGPLLAKNTFYYQPNRTQQMAIDWQAQVVQAAASSCAAPSTAPAWQPTTPVPYLQQFWSSNIIGRTSLDLGAISFGGLQTKMCDLDGQITVLLAKTQE